MANGGSQASKIEQGSEILQNLKGKISKYQDLKDIPAEAIVEIASGLGKHLKEIDLKTTQIRKFLDWVRRIDGQFNKGKGFKKDSVILLKPKLAYSAGREPKVKPLMEVLDPAIIAGSNSYESFKKLLALIEAIISYHKFYGGGD